MTEEEAKTKWCFRLSARDSGYYCCVASECMAWRKTYESILPLSGNMIKIKPAGGYCGLAGVEK